VEKMELIFAYNSEKLNIENNKVTLNPKSILLFEDEVQEE
jgi:hypothetical protein